MSLQLIDIFPGGPSRPSNSHNLLEKTMILVIYFHQQVQGTIFFHGRPDFQGYSVFL